MFEIPTQKSNYEQNRDASVSPVWLFLMLKLKSLYAIITYGDKFSKEPRPIPLSGRSRIAIDPLRFPMDPGDPPDLIRYIPSTNSFQMDLDFRFAYGRAFPIVLTA